MIDLGPIGSTEAFFFIAPFFLCIVATLVLFYLCFKVVVMIARKPPEKPSKQQLKGRRYD